MVIFNRMLDYLGAIEVSHPKETAMVYILIACFCSSLLHLIFKIYISEFSYQRLLLSRFQVAITINTVVIQKQNIQAYFPKEPKLQRGLILQAVFMVFSFGGFYAGVKYINITDAVVLMNIGPIIVGIYGWLLYNAEYNKEDILLALVSFAGVVFIAQPDYLFHKNSESNIQNVNRLFGVCLSVFGAFFYAAIIIVSKHEIGNKPSPWIIWQYGIVVQSMVLPLIYPTTESEKGEVFPLGLVIFGILSGVIGNISNYFFYRGITLYKIGKIALLFYTQILFNLMYDIFYFKQIPTGYTIFGSILVITSSVICFFKQKVKENKNENEN